MRKGRMACGGDNPPYAQITPPLRLPGPSFCWQGPQCRSIFDLTSTANHRNGAQCQEEVGLFAYWAGASKVGGNVRKGMRRRAGRGLGKYSRTEWGSRITHTGRINQVAHKQTNKEDKGECRERGFVTQWVFWDPENLGGNKISTVRWWRSEEELWGDGSSWRAQPISREVP